MISYAIEFKLKPTKKILINPKKYWYDIVQEYIPLLSFFLKKYTDPNCSYNLEDVFKIKKAYWINLLFKLIKRNELKFENIPIERIEIALLVYPFSSLLLKFQLYFFIKKKFKELYNFNYFFHNWDKLRQVAVKKWFDRK